MREAYVGQVCWTQLSAPGGLVEVLRVNQDGAEVADAVPWVQVRHVLDHPYGYARQQIGWYPVRDLQPCAWPEEEGAPQGEDARPGGGGQLLSG